MSQVSKLLVKKPFTRQAAPSPIAKDVSKVVESVMYSEVLPPSVRMIEMTQADFAAEYDPRWHKIYDKSIYPDRTIMNDKGEVIGTEYISRVSFALQKMTALKQCVHLIGNPPKLTATKESDNDLFIQYKEYRRAKGIHAAMYLGIQSALNTADGAVYFFRDKKSRLKWKVWSYDNGESLIPTYYDDGVTLKYFVRRYMSTIDNSAVDTIDVVDEKSVTTYAQLKDNQKTTKNKVLEFLGIKDGRWTQVSDTTAHGFTQVPVAYQRNKDVAWGDGQELVETVERTISDLRDNNAYLALGILFLKGDIEVLPSKNRTGKVISGEQDSDAKLIEQNDVSQGFKFEIETYLQEYYDITGTVIIRNEDLKGGDITGAAIRNYYNPAIKYALNQATNYHDFLNQIESITMEGMGLEKGITTSMKGLDVISEIEVYVPANTMEVAQKIATLVGIGAISKETAQEINEYAAPNERERITKQIEDEERRSIESVRNQDPAIEG